MLKDFISLIYPETCCACNNTLRKGEASICTQCFIKLPKTDYHLDLNNPLVRKFYGKVKIRNAFSYLKFVKSGSVQKLMHQLKYKGREDIGILLGKWFGLVLANETNFNYDLIIPVPMHKHKRRKRGYNQADSIAEGLAHSLELNWSSEIIFKSKSTESQTKKNRFNRWINTKSVFSFYKEKSVEELNVLLVDDVVTTGSTLESCAKVLLNEGKCKSVSIATIAIAT